MIAYPDQVLYSRSGNEALEINPPTGVDFHITDHGSDWYWTVFSLFGFATLAVIGHSFFKARQQRLFHYLTATALFVLSIQYFTQASDLGWTDVQAEFNHVTTSDQSVVPGLRQIFYARWVGYFLAFPVYLVNYAALCGASWSEALFTVAAQEVTIISFLIGMLVESTYKWGYYTFGVVGFFLVGFNLLFTYRKAIQDSDPSLTTHITIISACSVILYMLYPIAWALSEGGNVIQPDSEAAFYGVLDVVYFLIIGGYFHWVASKVNFEQRGITGFQSSVFASKPVIQPISEKFVSVPVSQPTRMSESTAAERA